MLNGEIIVLVSRDWLLEYPSTQDIINKNKDVEIGMAN